MSPAPDYFTNATNSSNGSRRVVDSRTLEPQASPGHRHVYFNPRLDPANFLEGPLSTNPATRLRQMLARPGIVVSVRFIQYYQYFDSWLIPGCSWYLWRD